MIFCAFVITVMPFLSFDVFCKAKSGGACVEHDDVTVTDQRSRFFGYFFFAENINTLSVFIRNFMFIAVSNDSAAGVLTRSSFSQAY